MIIKKHRPGDRIFKIQQDYFQLWMSNISDNPDKAEIYSKKYQYWTKELYDNYDLIVEVVKKRKKDG